MLHIPVATRGGGSKTYSRVIVEDLEALKSAIAQRGWSRVHLVLVDPWDGSWEYPESDIPLDDMAATHLEWLTDSGRTGRYLQCGLGG
jgi:hypothetical protein